MRQKKNRKERTTTKQQRYVSTWSLFKVCHALLGLGSLKIAIFLALGFGYTLPDMGIVSSLTHSYQQWVLGDGIAVPADKSLTAENTQETQSSAPDSATPNDSAQAAATQQQATPNYNEPAPQGSAAVRAALAYRSESKIAYANRLEQHLNASAAQNTAPVVQKPKAEKPAQEDVSWWDNVLSITSLPIPRLGVDQVAYAATLDTPLTVPPPPAPQTGTVGVFTPPAQILPAGTAGPQLGVSATQNLLVPNTNPPAPNLDAYIPPEDPNRKQQELARREQEILMLQKQMEQRLKELQAAEKNVQGMLKEAKNVEGEKVNTLINMYANMKPRQAGAALESVDEAIAAKILVSMKAKQAGEILSYMNPVKTAKLTELLSRMRLQQ